MTAYVTAAQSGFCPAFYDINMDRITYVHNEAKEGKQENS